MPIKTLRTSEKPLKNHGASKKCTMFHVKHLKFNLSYAKNQISRVKNHVKLLLKNLMLKKI